MREWKNFLEDIEKELGNKTVQKWLRSLRVLDFDAGNLYLEALDSFQILWFEEHMRERVQKRLLNNNGRPIQVHLSLEKPQTTPLKKTKTKREQKPPQLSFEETLDPYATFENFIESDSNILSYKLLCKLTFYDPISKKFIPSNDSLSAFNPIYLYGPEGSGKSHLLCATAHALKNQNRHVLYTSAKNFTAHYIASIQSGDMSAFRSYYRTVDALLVDDIDYIARKGATQEEFFHTFNTLHLASKQVVLASKGHPSELHYIEPRLISRFEWGIVIPVNVIAPQEIKTMIELKAKLLNYTLHPSVIQFLIESFKNPKAITMALNALILRHGARSARSDEASNTLTREQAEQLLKDLLAVATKETLTPLDIIAATASHFDIKSAEILSRRQHRELILPRQLAMYICRTKLKIPYKKIGDIFSRDHTTVMTSVKAIEGYVKEQEPEVMKALKALS